MLSFRLSSIGTRGETYPTRRADFPDFVRQIYYMLERAAHR